jgi:serine/threonine protein kinase
MYDSKEYIFLCVELCTGGELFDRIVSAYETDSGSFSEKQASAVIRQVASGLKYLHTQGNILKNGNSCSSRLIFIFIFLTLFSPPPLPLSSS